jgi:uncharacterized membrane protein YfcA
VSDLPTLIEISLAIFVASAFRTAFGFGEALIAVPLLSLLLPVQVGVPLAVLASIVIAAFIIIRDWQHIHFSSAGRLLIGTALGIPIGLLILGRAPETIIKAILGTVLLSFAIFSLCKPKSFVLQNDRLIWLFGFFAGVMGGSYGMNGPPLVIFGAGRKWSANRFRATLQAYFLPASILGMAGYYFSGLWTMNVNILFAESIPAIALGIVTGSILGRRMEGGQFERYLYIALSFVALVLLFQAC